MRQTVTIHHPATGATSQVLPQTVGSWRRAGWATEAGKRPKRRTTETPAPLPETPDAGASTTEEE